MAQQPSLEDLQGWRAQTAQITGADATGEGLSEAEAFDQIRALEELKAAAAAAQAKLTAHLYAERARLPQGPGRGHVTSTPAG